ncbi:uncharacterized protein LOC113553104 isoform X2 [Rhopalosiphum maidis]|uniref:uncharacterized protein LOC113553104 isoform X2 n=1 Tax=Rhopalosiphum maidis TaxID=43146 RepID=UPI000EFECA0E|nr:uncharacterized protein LOC113553104 isoform X2 [Rhopalosiphum maidis]
MQNYEKILIDAYDRLYTEDNNLKPDITTEFSVDQLYTFELIFKMKQTKINNAETWCKSNAVQIVEDTTANETTDKLPEEKFTTVQSIIEKLKQAKICDPNSSCQSDADTKEGTLNETIVKFCIEELKARGYVYNLGILNYAFFKKEPTLSSNYTNYLAEVGSKLDKPENASTNTLNMEETAGSVEKTETLTDEKVLKDTQDLQSVKILNSTEWCEVHKGEMLGYSNERREKLENNLKNREEVFLNHLFTVCIAILTADGFINLNGADNYKFSTVETYFIKPYTKYLDEEASKLIDEFEGTDSWCRRNHYVVGCLNVLIAAGYAENNTGNQNYEIIEAELKRRMTIIDFSNYETNKAKYLRIIKAMHSSEEIAQDYCMKLLDEKNENKEILSSTPDFCKQCNK